MYAGKSKLPGKGETSAGQHTGTWKIRRSYPSERHKWNR